MRLPEHSKSDCLSALAQAKCYRSSALALTDVKASDEASILVKRLIEMMSTKELKEQQEALLETEFGHSVFGMQEITQVEVLDVVRRLNSDIIMQLLPWIPQDIRNTEAVLIGIAKYHTKEHLARIFIGQKDDEIVVTEAVLNAAIESTYREEEAVKLLLDHMRDKTISTETLMKETSECSRSSGILKQLLNHKNGSALVTDALLVAAAENWHPFALSALLDHRGNKANIPESVLLAAVWNPNNENFQLLLTQYGSRIRLTMRVIGLALSQDNYKSYENQIAIQKLQLRHPLTASHKFYLHSLGTNGGDSIAHTASRAYGRGTTLRGTQ
jgi:hypothetical protein